MDFKVTIESQCDRGKYTGFLDRLQKFLNEECEAGVLKTNCDLHIEGDASFFSWGKFEGTEQVQHSESCR